jgi:GMP synthase (glutamine-hydrolysing)
MDVWASHKDEVIKPPENFKVLASSSICGVEAMKHKPNLFMEYNSIQKFIIQKMVEKIFENFYEVCKEFQKSKE